MNGILRPAATRRPARPLPALAPVARAIRTALATSAAMFALSMPAAIAAPHANGIARSECTAVVPSRRLVAALPAPLHDPALVPGAMAPASVHPAPRGAAASSACIAIVATATGVDGGNGHVGPSLVNHDDLTVVVDDGSNPAYAVALEYTGSDASLTNYGNLSATANSPSGFARARGIDAFGYGTGVTVTNAGDIVATGHADGGNTRATAIYAFAYGSTADVDNVADLTAVALADGGFAYATGIESIGYGGDSLVANSGRIESSAEATYAYAFGVFDLATRGEGNALVDNSGEIAVDASGDWATATGVIDMALRYGDADIVNTGTVTATATGTYGASANGLYNASNFGNGSVDNAGSVDVLAVSSDGLAIARGITNAGGTYASYYGDPGAAALVNSGDVNVAAHAATVANAIGIAATSSYFVEVINTGTIDVEATAVDGSALAVGAYLHGVDATTLRNYGSIAASAHSDNADATAYATLVYGGYLGIGLLVNGGDLAAEASGVNAAAYGAIVYASVASVFNDGSSIATATADGGDALALAAGAYGIWSAVENTGSLTASATALGEGVAQATGGNVYGYNGASMVNTGDVDAYALATDGHAIANGTYTLGIIYDAITTNSGGIVAHAVGEQAEATGVFNLAAYLGYAVTVNDGDVSAIAEGGLAGYGEAEATAFGIYNLAFIYDSVVENNGSVSAIATALEPIGPTEGFLQARALGILAVGVYGYGDTAIVNSGDISAASDVSTGYSQSWGAAVQTSGYFGGAAVVINDGTISATSHVDIGVALATGVYASNLFGSTEVANYGDIVAVASAERGVVNVAVDYAYATGITARSTYGDTNVANYGYVGAHAVSYGAINGARGIQASSGGYTTVLNAGTVVASGEAEVFGGGFATGIEAYGMYGVGVVNDGTVVAYGSAHALEEGPYTFYGVSGVVGVYANASFMGDATVVNNGTILATAHSTDGVAFVNAGAGASGVIAYAKYDAVVANYGDILVDASSELGIVTAYGVVGHGKYASDIHNAAGANISVIAEVGSLASDVNGGRAIAFGTHVFGGEHGTVTNDGSITVRATATADGVANLDPALASAWGASVGAYTNMDTADIANHGDITVIASAELGLANAYGTYASALWTATTTNSGEIVASATADNGEAWSTGSLVYAVHRTFSYDCDAYGCDYSNPIVTIDGGEASLANTGLIAASASADGGLASAYGAAVIGAFGATLDNGGDILAEAEGDSAAATGAILNSFEGAVSVTNTGSILAAAYGPEAVAVAVELVSADTNTLFNTGTLAAFGDGDRIAVRSSQDAAAAIDNRGTLLGAIFTGALDDVLLNAGLWHALGTSDFGAGVDTVTNTGTVLLDDAVVRLGAEGDAFANIGTLAALGVDNLVDLGGVGTFASIGTITFLDGAADDGLTVFGDFAGGGTIAFDASGIDAAADWLRIDGDASGTSVLDVRFIDAPSQATTVVPLVFVSGDAAADAFALGNVTTAADGFLALAFSLDAAIDATNASDDVFSLGVAVTGLNDNGALATALAPGAQALLDAQVGTLRQRQGVLPAHGDDVLAAWARTFSGSGSLDPDRTGAIAGDGAGFDQSNDGWELGLEARVADRLTLGLLLAESDGRQHLDDFGGTTRFDGRSVGVYGTWSTANGFYVDLSHRWSSLDAHLATGAAAYATSLSASALNLEAGFAGWQLGGANVVPQLQFTRSRLDSIAPLQGTGSSFVDHGGTSLRGRLGVAVDRTFAQGTWSWTPYGSFNAVHEFDGSYEHTINGGLEGETRTDGTSAMVELGVGAQRGNFSVTGGASWIDGGAQQGVSGGQLVLRWRW